MRKTRGVLALTVSAGMLFAACSGGGGSSAAPSDGASAAPSAGASQGGGESPAAELTPVRLQLQWAPQAQFAGYFAAREQGYFEAAIARDGNDQVALAGLAEEFVYSSR